ncbi:RagB/SusD family nutrient uptake outer membrane protein [Pedobacter sp. ISL-68]|uniref:RagB/SusD family nutrient uptake outer membrane protein n=1 Tax=unclassified Pedobacter TaxID=2628915 RepID=UPI001BE974CF|nr:MULTISPECIES: RagB/SusD family nutrient uptake outer membrane protein [unclassified Pedobacter]MBT2563383.1 RagB/SusD family nutrient uptake outer membrane protein [Pedobacter sp. ISL-64]MBT2588862.1 RagB/SusD family nutrient uptake outer membrane protein [Pedobacter sp. ISL-68]
MKKNILAIAALLTASQLIVSCQKQLDVNPRERILETGYYQTQQQAFTGLVAVYDQLGNQSSGYLTKLNLFSSASDDHFAGADSPSDLGDMQAMNNYTVNSLSGAPSYLWSKGFTGVYRANVLLKKIEGITMDASTKARYIAEAKALRAIFYFDLVRIFKNIPLILAPVEPSGMFDVTQVAPADVYKQIEKDLAEALPALPLTIPTADAGRLNQGAVHAVLGKVYLWEEKWAPAAAEFALVNGTAPGASTYGYKLLPNFADLWNVKNKFNSESILELSYNTTSNMGWGNVGSREGNVMGILVGPRNYVPVIAAKAPDYVSGWSVMPITKELFDLIHYDPRNKPTVANLDSLEKAGIVTYKHANDNTGYFVEKYAGRVSTKAAVGQLELNFGQNMYEIRLADTYLMEAEALLKSGAAVGAGTRAYIFLNAVRARVGLNPVAVTMDNIMKERRLELVAEGQRWFDLVRWGLAPTKLASKGFQANKNETLPIPQAELNNTKILQSKEWGGTK